MDNLLIAKEKYTPKVFFDTTNNIFEISGESYSEDAFVFYGTILNWLNDYLRQNDRNITVNFRLTYYNTSTSQAVFQLLEMFEKYTLKRKIEVQVNWYANSQDSDMIEDGQYYRDNFEILFFNIAIES